MLPTHYKRVDFECVERGRWGSTTLSINSSEEQQRIFVGFLLPLLQHKSSAFFALKLVLTPQNRTKTKAKKNQRAHKRQNESKHLTVARDARDNALA